MEIINLADKKCRECTYYQYLQTSNGHEFGKCSRLPPSERKASEEEFLRYGKHFLPVYKHCFGETNACGEFK